MSEVKRDEQGESLTVTRFPEGATTEQKREFATALVTAMDELQIEPGQELVLMAPDDLQAIRDELATANEENTHYEAELQTWINGEDDMSVSLRELVEDIDRGIRSLDDLREHLGVRKL